MATFDSMYDPVLRAADHVKHFSSVQHAMKELRNTLLPYTFPHSTLLETITILTRCLIESSGLAFYSLLNSTFRVSAIAQMHEEQHEERAKILNSRLGGRGCFFQHGNNRYYGVPSINISEGHDLPDIISGLQLTTRPR